VSLELRLPPGPMHRRSIVYCAREESNYLLLRDRNEDIAIPARTSSDWRAEDSTGLT